MNTCFIVRFSSSRFLSYFINGKFRSHSSFQNAPETTSKYSMITDVDLCKQDILNTSRSNRKKLFLNEKYIEIKMLFICDLGIPAETVSDLAADCKEIFSLDPEEIKIWIDVLISHSFQRRQVAELIASHPWLLLIPISKISRIIEVIQGNFELTRKEFPLFFINAPCVLADSADAAKTIDKYNYVHFIMSFRDLEEVVTSGIFRFSLDHLKLRYQFLYRRGQFYPVNRKFQSRLDPKPLVDIFCTTDQVFCEKLALCDVHELSLFKKTFAFEDNLRDNEELYELGSAVNVKRNTIVEIVDDIENEPDDPKLNTFADELTKHL